MKALFICLFILAAFSGYSQTSTEYFETKLGAKIFCQLKYSCGDTLYFELEELLYKIPMAQVKSMMGEPSSEENCGSENAMLANHMIYGKKATGLYIGAIILGVASIPMTFAILPVGIALGVGSGILSLSGIGMMNKAFKIGKQYYLMQNAPAYGQ